MSSVPRFHIDRALNGDGAEMELPAHVARQVATVLRMRAGEPIVVFDTTGREWPATLTHVDRGVARARRGEGQVPDVHPRRNVMLCQALLKGEKMEWVLQKGTELGVAQFLPLHTERVIATKASVPERWERIVVEATEQCGGTIVPPIHQPAPLKRALDAPGPRLFCWEAGQALHLASALEQAQPLRGLPIRLFVGPEGGFSEAEVRLAEEAGATLVSLGPRILRAETAAIAAATLALLAP